MGVFKSRNKFPVQGRTVLITGGSQGMGKALAQLLASRGANVVIVARNVQRLEAALNDIHTSSAHPSTQKHHYISADLTSSSEATRILTEATTWNDSHPPDLVFCCAGASRPGYFIETPPSILKEMMDTNYLSAAYIAHATCQAWLSRADKITSPSTPTELRHIVFVSSIAALIPITGYTPYSPSKIALRSLSEVLSQELLLYESHTPMRTHCVYAATIFSPGLEKENKTKPAITLKLEEDDGGQTPEQISLFTLQALERGDENITTNGFIGKALKAGSLGTSTRNGWGILDFLLSWVASIILPFVRRDLNGKVKAWGKEKKLGLGKGVS